LIGATDIDDWPGGIRQQFKAAMPMVESILRTVKQLEGLRGPLKSEIWDQGDGFACWKGSNIAAVLFPTAATITMSKVIDELKNAWKNYVQNLIYFVAQGLM
jgi:hypothetical protein